MQLNAHQKLFKFYWSMCFFIMISKQIILEYEQEEGNYKSKTYIVYYFQKSFFPYLSKCDINEGHC